MCSNINIYQYLVSIKTNLSFFHALEVVGRGSETQLQVSEYLHN